jgi:hypothetical protein
MPLSQEDRAVGTAVGRSSTLCNGDLLPVVNAQIEDRLAEVAARRRSVLPRPSQRRNEPPRQLYPYTAILVTTFLAQSDQRAFVELLQLNLACFAF